MLDYKAKAKQDDILHTLLFLFLAAGFSDWIIPEVPVAASSCVGSILVTFSPPHLLGLENELQNETNSWIRVPIHWFLDLR